ncbi:MAG: carboxypeptidase-like regulatory domain-containing protein [Cyclobacteriaceae bacterium]|nr:carboxypeptidase-like regulatory domain-containing protein [Cyclobacteriaceae bacterium]
MISAQSFSLFHGKIIDEETSSPLIYATISLRGTSIGTITNNDGDFEFYIPSGHEKDTLLVSMLSYSTYKTAISQLSPDKNHVIRLKMISIILNEVTINAEKISPNEIFKKAYQNLEETFPQEPFILRGFYRQLNTENDKNVLLVEAAVNISDKKTRLNNNFRLQEKVTVSQVRSSKSFFKNTDENYFEKSNTLNWLLVFNYAKYRNHFVMDRKSFVLDSIVTYNERSYFVISSTAQGLTGKNIFTLYIDSEDFSFLKIKNESVAHKGSYLQNFDVWVNKENTKVLKLTASSQIYQFKQYMGKMYMEHARSYSKGVIINTKTDETEWNVTDENMLVINEVVVDNSRAAEGVVMDNHKNIKFLSKDYDAKFWSDYKLVNLTPLTKKQLSDLEQDSPLIEQFKKQTRK